MCSKELYKYAVNHATKMVMQVKSSEMELPTPDTEWIVRDLLNHMLYELAWGADVVQGKTLREVGSKYDDNLLNVDVKKSWQHYEVITMQAVKRAYERGIAHLSYADTMVGEYLIEAANDFIGTCVGSWPGYRVRGSVQRGCR